MTLERFLQDLSRQGIQLWAEGDSLCFRAPEGKLDARVRGELRRLKPEILTWLSDHDLEELEPSGIRPLPDPERRHQPFPLTDIQEGYWVGRSDLVEHGGISAHTYQEVDFAELDPERFRRAWQRLIERHEMLRAVILPDGSQCLLSDVPPFALEVEDLRAETTERAELHLAELRERLSSHGPRIDQWPLFELRLLHLPGGRYRLLVAVSLLVADALSFRTLLAELVWFYRQPDAEFEPLELSFRDYVLALRAAEAGTPYQRSLAYWQGRLATLPPAPDLPLVASGRRADRARFLRRRGTLSPEVWKRIKDRARFAGVTPTVAVATAYAEVLRAWSGSEHFTLNLLFFNRPPVHGEVDLVVGNFSSTVPLEVDFRGLDNFAERARRVQKQLFQDLEHAQVSGVRVLREWNRQRPVEARVILPVVLASTLNLGPTAPSQPQAGDLRGEMVYGCLQTPHVWLDHQVSEAEDGSLAFNWDALEELFPASLVADAFAAYQRLVAWLGAEDSNWGGPLPSLVPVDHLQERAVVNVTAVDLPELCLPDLVTRGARGRRDAPAVLGGRTLDFAELEARSRVLANQLRAAGSRPGELVAVVMEKGWEQAVAVLGILRAGAAYLPIDPGLPEARRRYLFEHAGAWRAVTQPWLAAGLSWPEGVALEVVAEPVPEEDSLIEAAASPADLAYVLYTSGSTGTPKGVAIEHRSAVNTLLDIGRRFGLGAQDRVLALSALSFDLSVFDFFGIWGLGGATVVPTPAQLSEPAAWTHLVREHGVTVWNSVPALAGMWVDFLEALPAEELPRSLRLVMLSGDWIPVGLPGRLSRLFPEAKVMSLGGATEASIWSIYFPIERVDPDWQSIPYGRPLGNQRFHVLDPEFEPCPRWVPGELYIGGEGLARGYHQDPDRTAESFVRQPRTGERLYKTGDVGRYLPGGDIEFLGRRDLQVKVQGYRIELGEIEAALAGHEAVKAAVVVARGPRRGDKRLVAYWVPLAPGAGSTAELTTHLRSRLPAYMVPTTFVQVEAFPLTANGKVDRSALPAPEEGRRRRPAAFVPPQGEIERGIAEIWEEVLERPGVGANDHFFELGGYSLLAVRLMARIRSRFGCELPLATLFTAPTVAELAALVAAGHERRSSSPLVPIQAQGSRPPLFLAHPVGGSVVCYSALARRLGEDQPVFGLELVDPAWAREGLASLAARYLAAIRQHSPKGPYHLGGWSMGGLLAYQMACDLQAAGEEVAFLAMIDAAPAEGTPSSQEELLAWWAADLWRMAGLEPRLTAAGLARLAPAERLPVVAAAAHDAGVLPPELAVEDLSRLLEGFLANAEALAGWRPGRYQGEVLLLQGRSSLVLAGGDAGDAWGWRGVAPGVEVVALEGDHYTLVQEPGVATLAEVLGERLVGAPA